MRVPTDDAAMERPPCVMERPPSVEEPSPSVRMSRIVAVSVPNNDAMMDVMNQ